MDLIDKFNALLDRSTQAVDDTRRVFSRIEEIMKPEDPKETVSKHFNILAITDFGFSDASFVQMEVKKDYMRKLRKQICEEFENEAVDVTVCFAGHKHNHKYKPKKMVKYVKYLTDSKLTKHKKNKKCKKSKRIKRVRNVREESISHIVIQIRNQTKTIVVILILILTMIANPIPIPIPIPTMTAVILTMNQMMIVIQMMKLLMIR